MTGAMTYSSRDVAGQRAQLIADIARAPPREAERLLRILPPVVRGGYRHLVDR